MVRVSPLVRPLASMLTPPVSATVSFEADGASSAIVPPLSVEVKAMASKPGAAAASTNVWRSEPVPEWSVLVVTKRNAASTAPMSAWAPPVLLPSTTRA